MLSEKGPTGNILYYNNAGGWKRGVPISPESLYILLKCYMREWCKYNSQKQGYFKRQLPFSCTVTPTHGERGTILSLKGCHSSLLKLSLNLSLTMSTNRPAQHRLGNHKQWNSCFLLLSMYFRFCSTLAICSQSLGALRGANFLRGGLFRLYLARQSSHFWGDASMSSQNHKQTKPTKNKQTQPNPQNIYKQSIWKSGNSELRFHKQLLIWACPVPRMSLLPSHSSPYTTLVLF